jgi:hypothetical protein
MYLHLTVQLETTSQYRSPFNLCNDHSQQGAQIKEQHYRVVFIEHTKTEIIGGNWQLKKLL